MDRDQHYPHPQYGEAGVGCSEHPQAEGMLLEKLFQASMAVGSLRWSQVSHGGQHWGTAQLWP